MPLLSPYYQKAITAFYEDLSVDQRRLLELLIALNEGTSSTRFSKLLTGAGLSRKDGKRYNPEQCDELFKLIQNANHQHVRTGQGLLLTPEFVGGIAEIVSKEEPLSNYAKRLYGEHLSNARHVDPYGAKLRRTL